MSLLVICCLLLPDYENPPCQPPPLCSWAGVCKVKSLAKGLVLSQMVHKGMSHEQVHRLLGNPSFCAMEGGALFEAYERYNIQVYWPNTLFSGKPEEPDVEVRWVAAW